MFRQCSRCKAMDDARPEHCRALEDARTANCGAEIDAAVTRRAGMSQSRIITEGAEYVVVNKPSGVPVPATIDNALESAGAFTAQARGTLS